jgi:hypothetical protein
MMLAALSFLLSGLAAFSLLCAFVALVPRVAGSGKSIISGLLQYILIAAVVVPACGIAIFGPLSLYEVIFSRPTTKDQRFWLLLGGPLLAMICLFSTLRTAVGRRYLSWQSRVA